MPLLSVIVLNWNGRHLLEDCLRSLSQQQFRDFETIVVDNGSVDGSVDFVTREYPEVRVVALDSNLGFCGGNNQGLPAVRGQYVLFLNNDTEVAPSALGELCRWITADPPEVGSWSMQLLRWDHRDIIDTCGIGYTTFGASYQIGSTQRADDASTASRWTFGASGGAGCFRRTVLEDIGAFDDDFFYSNEDVDLAFRAQLAGYRCRYIPTAVVYHRGSATAGATSDRTIYHIQRNLEWVFFKNMPTKLLWKYLPLHLAYLLGWVMFWSLKGKGKVVLRAKWDALRAWQTVRAKRRQIQSQRRVPVEYIESLIVTRKPRLRALWSRMTGVTQ